MPRRCSAVWTPRQHRARQGRGHHRGGGSPLNDVTELERVRFVMRRGVVHKLDGARQAFPID